MLENNADTGRIPTVIKTNPKVKLFWGEGSRLDYDITAPSVFFGEETLL